MRSLATWSGYIRSGSESAGHVGLSCWGTPTFARELKNTVGARKVVIPLPCCRRRWISAATYIHPYAADPPHIRPITGNPAPAAGSCLPQRTDILCKPQRISKQWLLGLRGMPMDFCTQTRNIFTSALESIHPAILAPVVFCSLVVTLWTYKCMMMVVFQNKIIYMPGVPLGARKETITDYEPLCSGIHWKEVKIPTQDGNLLGAAVAEVKVEIKKHVNRLYLEDSPTTNILKAKISGNRKRVVVVYFQGNASSTPPRLPMLSTLLRRLSEDYQSYSETPYREVIYTVIAPSYRGYWTSTGRPSQKGIEKDGHAIFQFLENSMEDGKSNLTAVQQKHERTHLKEHTEIIIWGQSIGANISMNLLANYLQAQGKRFSGTREIASQTLPQPSALILETPFVSIPDMLVELYPQKWLPYRYLTPFLRNLWDLRTALKILHHSGFWPRKLLILTAERDELVGPEQSRKVDLAVKSYMAGCGVDGPQVVERTRNVLIKGALHVECLSKHQGQREIIDLIKGVGVGRSQQP